MNSFNHVSTLQLKVSRNSKGKSVISRSFFTSPFKIMKGFERSDGGITVYQQTASAGILAGDRQEHSFIIEENVILELVSQSFEKIFKMEETQNAGRKINAKVGANATFIYTPLPCMPFSESDFNSRTCIELTDNSSRLVYSDILCGGRKEHGELFDFRSYRNLIEIKRSSDSGNGGSGLVYRENTVLEGSSGGIFPEKKAFLKTPAMYGNYSHLGTMLLFGFGLKSADLLEMIGLPAKLLYTAENLEMQKGKPLVSVTQTLGGGSAIKILANFAEEIQNIFEKIKQGCL